MGLDLNKGTVDLIDANGDAITTIDVVGSWEDAKATGWRGKVGMKNKVDVDLMSVVIGSDGSPVNRIAPDKTTALGEALVHHGNVTSGQGEDEGETMTLRLSQIREEDSDIDTIALIAVCQKGTFDKVDSATIRLWNGTGETRSDIGRVRVPLDGAYRSVVIGLLKKTATGWTFTKATNGFSNDTEWKALGRRAALAA